MSILHTARSIGEAALALLYPPHCAACHADTAAGVHLCAECARRVRRIEAPFCARCSEPFDGAIARTFTCSNCADRRLHFDAAVSGYLSRGVVREFIHRFKYERHYYLRHQLADWLAAVLEDERIRECRADFLVPVPLHAARFREREFNQAEVLARLLSARSGIPLLPCLQRTRYTTTQTRLDRQERMENLRGAFTVRQNSIVRGSHLILVDDVLTTGSTVDECARVLRQSGAASIRVVTVARG
jgi:competence protein ComFC